MKWTLLQSESESLREVAITDFWEDGAWGVWDERAIAL
jgi:hypothetical protein